eukprot:2380999-Prymnesium_polylepis.1
MRLEKSKALKRLHECMEASRKAQAALAKLGIEFELPEYAMMKRRASLASSPGRANCADKSLAIAEAFAGSSRVPA